MMNNPTNTKLIKVIHPMINDLVTTANPKPISVPTMMSEGLPVIARPAMSMTKSIVMNNPSVL